MNVVGCILLVVASVSSQGPERLDCAITVWSDWMAWTAAEPGGTRTRTRTVVRTPQNGGNPCPTSLIETEPWRDPWDRQDVAMKFHNNFITGHYQGEERFLPRDILFIIDMSGSISRSEWTLAKQTLANLIERLCGSVGPGRQNNRIAVVSFSNRVVLNFNFKTHWSIASIRNAILNMRQEGRLTCTGDALVFAHNNMFEPDTGIRPASESIKEVLVLTDGQSNCGADLPLAAIRLQRKAYVYAIAIGRFGIRGKAEIVSMVSRPLTDHVFSIANFIDFSSMIEYIYAIPDACLDRK